MQPCGDQRTAICLLLIQELHRGYHQSVLLSALQKSEFILKWNTLQDNYSLNNYEVQFHVEINKTAKSMGSDCKDKYILIIIACMY